MTAANADVRFNEIYYGPEDPEDGRQFIELLSTTGGAESVENLWILESTATPKPASLTTPARFSPVIELGAATGGVDTTGSNGLFLWRDSTTVLDTSNAPGVQGPAAGTTVYVKDHFPGREDLGFEFPRQMRPRTTCPRFSWWKASRALSVTISTPITTGPSSLSPGLAWSTQSVGMKLATPGSCTPSSLEEPRRSSRAASAPTSPAMIRSKICGFLRQQAGENLPGFVGPFPANDGFGWISPAGSDAQFQDGRRIVVGSDSRLLGRHAGSREHFRYRGLFLGDTDHDGDVDADDIDLLYDNLGVVGTDFDVAVNFGPANQSDVDALVRDVLNTSMGTQTWTALLTNSIWPIYWQDLAATPGGRRRRLPRRTAVHPGQLRGMA